MSGTLGTVGTVEQLDQHGPQIGNTSSSARINIKARAWIWTWNNFELNDKVNMEAWCKKECAEYVFQEETGEEGTIHLQGFWYFKSPRSFQALKKTWDKMHLEKANNIDAARDYCRKSDTRSGDTMQGGPRLVKDPLEGLELKQWQVDLLARLDEQPNNREIIWIFDHDGGAGKTTLAKHLCIKYQNEVLYLSGGPSNCKYGITSFLYTKKKGKLVRNENDLRIAIFDYTRSQDDKVSYQALEEIKNGIFFNTKYECMQVIYNCPHVVVFANFMPEKKKLSGDRWTIIDVDPLRNMDPFSELL